MHYIEIIGALVFSLKEKMLYLEDHARYLNKKIDNRSSQAMRTIKAVLEDDDE
ncbi:MAG: hypothetical protein MZV70_29230 [Desulfobacterales bacterium]|nr:hypothetical protein [Desulfobacterales bacterium]